VQRAVLEARAAQRGGEHVAWERSAIFRRFTIWSSVASMRCWI